MTQLESLRLEDEEREMKNDASTYQYRYHLLPEDALRITESKEYKAVGKETAKGLLVQSYVKGYNDSVKVLLEYLKRNCSGACETCPMAGLAYELWEYEGSECPVEEIPEHFGML